MTRKMKAFICVYRHGIPLRRERIKTEEAANTLPLLQRFLDQYDKPDCFYDWGDDPGFFSAKEMLGNVRAASWGVCRPDVRTRLSVGDYIIFFCGKQNRTERKTWDYYLVGCATVKYAIPRYQIWSDSNFSRYRQFFNILACSVRDKLIQHETFHDYHKDWEHRANVNYLIFDPDPAVTGINIVNPLHVATKSINSELETWFSDNKVRDIERILFLEPGIKRRLRTTNLQRPHVHITLHNAPNFRNAPNLTSHLKQIRSRILEYI